MEPYTEPIKSVDDLTPGQLLLSSTSGVVSFLGMSLIRGEPAIAIRFAGGAQGLAHVQDLEKFQIIRTDPGPDQPLLDRPDCRPREWLRFLQGVRAGTLFRHYTTPLTSHFQLVPGQLLLHSKHGVADYVSSIVKDGKPFFVLEFANGWRQEIASDDLSTFQIVCLDASSGRRPGLDEYPNKNQEWERFLISERGRPKSIYKDRGERQLSRIAIKESVRHEVWRRDGGKCVRCGSREKLEFDHIVPVIKGGSDTARNIELLCEVCNRKKGARI